MRLLVQYIYTNQKHARVFEWAKLVSITGSTQIIVQALALASGILVIRLLPTPEYALYTLANTMLGTMTVLADSGISAGVMSQGGQVWQDRQKLGSVVATGLDLRRKFAVGGLLVAIPILVFLLLQHGASWLMSTLIMLSLLPAFFSALSGTVLQIGPKLCQDVSSLQMNQLMANSGRLILIGLTIFVFPWAFVAIASSSLPQVLANFHLRKISGKFVDLHQRPAADVRKKILAVVKRILPGSVYLCLSTQITIWLISVFGSTEALAQVGALSRLSMVLNIFQVLFATLIVPRFARMVDNQKILVNRYLQIHVSLLALAAMIIGAVWLFSSQVLWILGQDYADLQYELILSITGGCLVLVAGSFYALFTGRGWIINPIISLPIKISSIVFAAVVLDVSSLEGVLMLNIFVEGVNMIMNGLYGFIKIRQIS